MTTTTLTNGQYKITNAQHPKVVVTLNFGSAAGTIIMWTSNYDDDLQKWNLTKLPAGNQFILESVSTPGSFVSANGWIAGAGLSGSANTSIWALQPVSGGTSNLFNITTTDGKLAWFIDYGSNNTPVSLQPFLSDLGKAVVWKFTAV